MKTPKRLQPLIEDGMIDDVISQLMSGKEAQVFVVRCGDAIRCAKVYKEANKRSFKQAVLYQEGRTVRNSRRARAMAKGTRFGQKEREDEWLNAEVSALYRLADAKVRVPTPYAFDHGVLIMEMIADTDGHAAPRLNDVVLTEAEALDYHGRIIADVVRMLCAGLVHGDLSEFNILVDANGPVIIDLPQAVNAAGNNNAKMMLARDVENMRDYFGRIAPALLVTDYANEMWALFEKGKLKPDTVLSGHFEHSTDLADLDSILQVIDAAREEELDRRAREREANGELD